MQLSKPFIQFLVANYNSIDHIHILVKSLRTYHPGVSYQLLVADQGSTDGSLEYLEKLEEVKLWKLEEREFNKDYNENQRYLVEKYNLWSYLHLFFVKRTIEVDARKFHGAAINFLVGKVDAPLFATLDTDMEFLGPFWFQPFLENILVGNAVVGTTQDPISFHIGKFFGFTCFRTHPCLAVYDMNKIPKNIDFNTDDCFELRMPMIHRCLEEDITEHWQLGDMGHKVFTEFWKNKNICSLPDEEFYSTARHFQGATVKKDKKNHDLIDWLLSIEKKPKLKELFNYGRETYKYSGLNDKTLLHCSAYWASKNPSLPKQPKIPIFVVDK
jgi:glycosyltransferase involved in cell wall biosynthesis